MSAGVTIKWDRIEEKQLLESPDGVVGRMLARLGSAMVADAKARCLVKTGRMRNGIRWSLRPGPDGLYLVVESTAIDPKTGFPYPIVHEGIKVRDRIPHRSLIPAMRDIQALINAIGKG